MKVISHSLLTEYDIFLFRAGKHFQVYNKLGSHCIEHDKKPGVQFGVWAPNARQVSVVGDFNNWDRNAHQLFGRWDHSGIWEGFIPGIEAGANYKYSILDYHGRTFDKGDPYAFFWQQPPNTASRVWKPDHHWQDDTWMKTRKKLNKATAPMSVYEVHMGSWKRKLEAEKLRPLTYTELAGELLAYVKEMGFTHVEFLPVAEHPYAPSWGYQITGYYAPTSRFGTPEDFMQLVDTFHQEGIGIILDWVPSHFPSDGHGLAYYDGSHLYEHHDPRKGYHPDWTSYIFNYGRYEVRSFLISNALYWLREYHIDGLRVDAVASMLYLDYSRNEGEWVPNPQGGRENLEAISFLQETNEAIQKEFPEVYTIAEESTAWPAVTHDTKDNGLGFDLKWMMGWMHDSLEYFQHDPLFRKHNQNLITFSFSYAFSEKYILPLSHDEVVHGKASLIYKMPGDEWQRFANLRLLYSLMFVHPGAKLLFMGDEIAQTTEWNFKSQLDWHLLQYDYHKGVQTLIKDLNNLYKKEKALYQKQYEPDGFEWIAGDDVDQSVVCFLRKGKTKKDTLLIVSHYTPVPRKDYRVGVPFPGEWEEVFNSNDKKYGGTNEEKPGKVKTEKEPWNGREQSIVIELSPLALRVFKYSKKQESQKGLNK